MKIFQVFSGAFLTALVLCFTGFATGNSPLADKVAAAGKPEAKRSQTRQLASFGFPVPANGVTCKSAFKDCLKTCTGLDVNGCTLTCETDCGVCAVEATGKVDDSLCALK